MGHVLIHSIIDAIKIFPIVFIVYLIIEYLEKSESKKPKLKKVLVGRFSPIFSALIGVIPQCGFSIVATKFYQKGLIYLGALIAVFVATSDEALPILFSRAISGDASWVKFLTLIGVKVVYAIVVGFVINLFVSKKQIDLSQEVEVPEHSDGCCGHEIGEKSQNFGQFIIHPLLHSVKIVLYIFAVNFLISVIIDLVIGEDRLSAILINAKIFQPLICAGIGLIPNCAVSVALAELYCDNLLSFSGVIAGLTANSGLGLLVLFKDRKNIKKAVFITLVMFIVAVIIGYLTYFL